MTTGGGDPLHHSVEINRQNRTHSILLNIIPPPLYSDSGHIGNKRLLPWLCPRGKTSKKKAGLHDLCISTCVMWCLHKLQVAYRAHSPNQWQHFNEYKSPPIQYQKLFSVSCFRWNEFKNKTADVRPIRSTGGKHLDYIFSAGKSVLPSHSIIVFAAKPRTYTYQIFYQFPRWFKSSFLNLVCF